MTHSIPTNTSYIHYLPEEYGEPDLFVQLNQAEQERASLFKFETHRNFYIKSHVFLRKVLSYHTGHPPESWDFTQGSHGKPYIKNRAFQSLQFNLSHTQGMIVCIISRWRVGVDVEGSRPLKHIKQMSQRNFSDRECNDVFSTTSSSEQLHRFYTYWTLKESFVKALGCGLTIPLKQISFIRKNKDWALDFNVESLNINPNNSWTLINKPIPTGYQLSASIEAPAGLKLNTSLIDSTDRNSQNWQGVMI